MSVIVLSIALLMAPPQASVSGVPSAAHAAADAPLLVLPRESLAWTTDGFGQVIGATMASKPLPARVRSIEPTTPLPAPLSAARGPSSLRIIGKSDKGMERDIAVLRWDGHVIMWQRMPVPAAAFGKSLAGLAQWMATDSFTAELEGRSPVRVATEPQEVKVAVGTESGQSVTVPIAGIPQGAQLRVPAAAAHDGQAAQGLVELGRDDMSCRLSTAQDTVLDIDVTKAPPQVRVTVQTPSSLQLERAVRDLEATDEVLKGAPQDQQAILGPQRAAQQTRVDELRKAAASERVRPTDSPIHACLMDPATGREHVTIMISIAAQAGDRGSATPRGTSQEPASATQPRRGAP